MSCYYPAVVVPPSNPPPVKSTLYSINKYETPLGFLSRAAGDCTGHWADKVISRVIGHNDSLQRQQGRKSSSRGGKGRGEPRDRSLDKKTKEPPRLTTAFSF